MPDRDLPSFADMLARTRGEQQERKSARDELPRVGRPFRANYDSDCESMIAGRECDGRIEEGEDIAYVDDEIACSKCVLHAQGIRDDFFER